MNPRLPCLLLVEDDPVSAAFLRDAAAALPARVVGAGTLAEAMAEAAATRFDLWLVDANLPDGRGESLLQALRARGDATPALAHTAAADAPMRERLLAAGFADVLCKPIGVPDLHAAVCAMLADLGRPALPEEAVRSYVGRGIANLVKRALAGSLDVAEDDAPAPPDALASSTAKPWLWK